MPLVEDGDLIAIVWHMILARGLRLFVSLRSRGVEADVM